MSFFAKPLLAAPPRVASTFILVAVFLDMAGLGISITVLPALIGKLAGEASAGWINGVFVAVWAIAQFAASPTLGALSDRFGRRPLLLLSMLGLGLDYVAMALAPSLAWLLVGRIVSGITCSSFSICYAYVTDVTVEEKRAAAFGRLGAAFGLGFILGPAVGGLLGAVSVRAPFWAATGFSLANAVFGFLVLPESLPTDRRSAFALSRANPLGALRLLRSHPELGGLAISHLASQFAGASIASVYVLYVVKRFAWSMQMVGASLAMVGVVVAIVQGVVLGRATDWLGERKALLIGLACGAVSLALWGVAQAGWMIFAGILLFGFWGLQGPATLSLMSRRISGDEQGQLQGAVASLTSLADGTGPFVFGALYGLTAGGAGGGPMAGVSFLVAAGLLVATGIFTASVLRRELRSTAPA